jgi:Ras-related protein Rab-2A
MQDVPDLHLFSPLFKALKSDLENLSIATWSKTVKSFCLVAKHFSKIPNQEEAWQLLLDGLTRLLDPAFDAVISSAAITQCCDYFFKLRKSQAILPILNRLKDHGDIFLAHEGTAFLEEVDEDFEKEVAFSIANYYRIQGNYRLSQFYLAYGSCSLSEMQHNEWLFLAEDRFRCDMKSWKNCAAVFEEFLVYGDGFWKIGDFKKAKEIYQRLENLLDEYARHFARSEEYDSYSARCIQALTREFPSQAIFSREIIPILKLNRSADNKKNWSDYIRENVLYPLCEATERELGAAPCQFSLLVLGSLARDEACPYSDIEFVITWRKIPGSLADEYEIKSYLRRFVLLLELKIISLGETRDLASLPQGLSQRQHQSVELIQNRMKRGLQFDSAGIYPFSFASEDRFLFEVKESMPLSSFQLSDGLVRYNIAEALYLYGNKEVSQDFIGKVRSVLEKDDFCRELARDFSALQTWHKLSENALSVNIKDFLLTPPQSIIKAMAIYHGIETRSSLARVDALVERHILIPEAGKILKALITRALELRTEAHKLHESENDELSLVGREELLYLIKQVYPLLKIFFETWLKNPVVKNYGVEFVHAKWLLDLQREVSHDTQESDIVIHKLSGAPVYLNAKLCAEWIDPKTGEFKEELRKKEDGRRIVVPVGADSFAKYRPECPPMQRAMSSFCDGMSGDGLPVKLCVFENRRVGIRYPVLFSMSRGETLAKKTHRKVSLKDLEPQINHYHYSIRIFQWIVFHLEDVKEDNVTFEDARFHTIDDDHALVDSIVERDFVDKTLNRQIKLKAKSILPCFDALRKPIDPEAKALFAKLSPVQYVKNGLVDMNAFEEEFISEEKHFVAWAEHKTDPCIVPWLLEKGMTTEVCARIYRLQQALKSTEEDSPVTLLDLICRVDPHLGDIYSEVFKFDTPEERFAALPTDYITVKEDGVVKRQSQFSAKECVKRSLALPKEKKSKLTLRQIFEQKLLYTAKLAQDDELTTLESFYATREETLTGIKDNTFTVDQFKVLSDFLKEDVINNLIWKDIPVVKQKQLLLCLAGVNLRELRLNDCEGLDSDILRGITNKAPDLRVLEIRGCVNVTGSVVRDVAETCSRLERVVVSGTNIDSITPRLYGGVPFPQLKRLKTERCGRLGAVYLDAPLLLNVTSTDCLLLGSARFNSPKLQRLNFAGCTRLRDLDLGKEELGNLVEVNLIGCNALPKAQVEKIFRQAPDVNVFVENLMLPVLPYDYLFKITLLSDILVGKSSLSIRYTDDKFDKDYHHMHPGVSWSTKKINIGDHICKLQIWETAGDNGFRSLTRAYIKDVNGIILSFSLTHRDNFERLPTWVDDIQKYAPADCPVMLVGTKLDLIDERAISREEAEAYALENGAVYFEASAKTGENVTEVFETLAKMIYSKKEFRDLGAKAARREFNSRAETFVTYSPQPKKSPAPEKAIAPSSPEPTEYTEYLFKVVLVGAPDCGKTCFVDRSTEDTRKYMGKHTSLGVGFCLKMMEFTNSIVRLQLWDIQGDLKNPMFSVFLAESSGFILAFDLTRRESFFLMLQYFQKIIERSRKHSDTGAGSTIIIVGMKSDLIGDRKVKRDEAEEVATAFGVPYIETSAKDDICVTKTFDSSSVNLFDVVSKISFVINREKIQNYSQLTIVRDVMKVFEKHEGFDSSEIFKIYCRNLNSLFPEIRQDAFAALGKLGKLNYPEVIQALTQNLKHKDAEIRKEAAAALEKIHKTNGATDASLVPQFNSPVFSPVPRSPPSPRQSASGHDEVRSRRNSLDK